MERYRILVIQQRHHFITVNNVKLTLKLPVVTQLLIFLLSFSTIAPAQLIEAEGNAVIGETGVGAARQLAIKDAMRQAALQAGATVKTTSQMAESVVISDSVQIRATGTVKDVVVLDEWVGKEDEIYYVLVRAYVTDSQPQEKDHQQRYKKKVAVMQFDVADRRHIHDLPDFEADIAKEFMRRLSINQALYGIDASAYVFSSSESIKPYLDLGHTPRQVLVELAERLGTQFIVTGTIRDMGTTRHPLWIRLRHAEFEVSLWDGLSGTLIAQERLNASVWESFKPFDFPVAAPTMTDKFFASEIGQQTHLMLNELVRRIGNAVHEMPFMARVIKSDGKHVYLDVGATSQIRVGDTFMAYKQADEPLMDVNEQLFFGYEESPASSVVIKRVQPRFAVGELEGGNKRLYAGDVIRFQW